MSRLIRSDLEILIVDDERFSRSILSRILQKLGVGRIRHAEDGSGGMTALRCLGWVDCVFLDFNMPNVNGLELLKAIRTGADGVDRGQPVMMLTGHRDLRLVQAAMALDVTAFLSKPASLDMVAQRLNRVLSEPDRNLKPATAYREIALPDVAALSDPPAGAPARLPPARRAAPGAVLMRLENVPAYSRLVRDINGPDGEPLMPAGAVLSPRLLTLLRDLSALDDCVAELLVQPPPPDAAA